MMTSSPLNNNSPQYTIRMLVTKVISEEKQEHPIALKKFSHFTLGCTLKDESDAVFRAINTIAKELKDEIVFEVNGIINLNTEEHPLWGVKINFGEHNSRLRRVFSILDPIMCRERNGNFYIWDVDNYPSPAQLRCPHVTIGDGETDREKALQMVNLKYRLTFGKIDYKKIGPHDPHISVFLNEKKRLNTIQPDEKKSSVIPLIERNRHPLYQNATGIDAAATLKINRPSTVLPSV